MVNKIVMWLVGKKVLTATGQLDAVSKAKLIALIGIILPAVVTLSAAWGHPVVIPDYVYKILAAAGLWTLRDSIAPKNG